MARILGAVASSHTPTIGFALDKQKQDDPIWAPIFNDYKPVQAWLAAKKPDVLLMIFNDHVTSSCPPSWPGPRLHSLTTVARPYPATTILYKSRTRQGARERRP